MSNSPGIPRYGRADLPLHTVAELDSLGYGNFLYISEDDTGRYFWFENFSTPQIYYSKDLDVTQKSPERDISRAGPTKH